MTKEDYLAVFDLVIEHYKVRKPKVTVKATQKGTARYHTWSCTLPIQALEEGEAYATYYAVHEAIHFVIHSKLPAAPRWQENHGPTFKQYEKEALAMFDLEPVYSRAYPKALKSNGQVVWLRSWR